ncbi:MAG: hypothetical protein R6X19_00280 [Kiritimatiellia bacterium]
MMKSTRAVTFLGGLFLGATVWGQAQTHTNLQAVNASGVGTWAGPHPFVIRGVLLNDPEEMLDSAWAPAAETDGAMGAQWQMFFQAAAGDDRGGTACWMGQNYNSLGVWIPEGNAYAEAEWSNEMTRVNHDPQSLRRFRKGDLVDVTAQKSLFYGGKVNINESHRVSAANNFSVTLVQAGFGLPDPEVIRLSDLVNEDDGNPGTHEDLFDQTRQTGGERYQGRRVRIESIRMATNHYASAGWGKTNWADRLCTVSDGEGRYFPLRVPLTDLGPVPSDWFSAVGIINQESGSGSEGRHGYELFVQEIGPTLKLAQNGGKMLIYWSGTYTNFDLEYSTNLTATAGWQRVQTAPVKWISVEEDPASTGGGARFYRLKQQ